MTYTLTVDISANSEGLIYAITDGNTYISQGYTVVSNNNYYSTVDVVNQTNYSSDIGVTGGKNSIFSISSIFRNTDVSNNDSIFIYYPISSDSNSVELSCKKRNNGSYTYLEQVKMVKDPNANIFTFYDSSNNSNGNVEYDKSLNRFTAYNDLLSKYNYQNVSIVANAGMSEYFYENGTGGSQSSEVNATYAMNASVFDRI
jgi:hypothetical protein